ncbi:MAG: hypothetical protein ACOC38_01545 [Promethearchaeia archaeon]
MSYFRTDSRIILALVAVLLLSTVLHIPVEAQTENLNPVVVMYDESHSQQFPADDEEDGIKLMLDMVNDSSRYLVKTNSEAPLNLTTLSDVDILILADPDASAPFEKEEIAGISDMLSNGSSLLALGDPTIDQNSTYWSETAFRDIGENDALNRLFSSINMTGVRFSVNETPSGMIRADSLFDHEHALNETSPQLIELDATTWNSDHPIFNDINRLVTMTATLKPIDAPSAIATGYETSFAQYRRGPNTFGNTSFPNMTLSEFEERPLSYSAINGTFPPWLSAFEFNSSRVVIGGSTIMFSGRVLDLHESDDRSNEQWFYQADNSRLFMNMLNWLSEDFVTAPEAIYPLLIISSVILLVGVAFYVFKRVR